MLLIIKACENSGILNAIYIIKMIIRIVLILVPVIIIVTSIISVVKAVINADDSKIKDAVYLMITKIIVGAIIFMIPTLTTAIISLIDNGKVSESYLACYKNATLEKIKAYKAKEEAEMQAEAAAKEAERKANAEKYENQQNELDKNNDIVSNRDDNNSSGNNSSSGNSSGNNNSSGNGNSSGNSSGGNNSSGNSSNGNNSGNNNSSGNGNSNGNGNSGGNTSSGTSSYGSSLNITSGTSEKSYNGVSYYEIIPPHPKKNMPLIVFLHGDGENGKINKVKKLPIVKKVAAGNLYGSGEYIFIAPVSPSGGWDDSMKKVIPLINHVVDEYSIDKSRIYINGFSAGAIATWYLANNNPSYFAAAVPVSCCGKNAKASNFTKTPIWAIVGSKESYSTCMNEFVNKINSSGGSAKITMLPGKNHSGTQSAYPTQEVFTWMLSKKK